VVACVLLAQGVAAAGAKADAARKAWSADTDSIFKAFDFVDDLKGLSTFEVSCVGLPVDEFLAQIGGRVLRCTGKSDESVPAGCRSAAIMQLAVYRADQLINGDDRAGGNYSMTLTWEKLPPDPDDASQYWQAVMVPVSSVESAVAREKTRITAGDATDAEDSRKAILEEVSTAVSTIEEFPEFPDDDSMRTAAIAWLTATGDDLDHGALKLLVARTGKRHPNKSFKRKTKALQQRETKAHNQRTDALNAVTEAFRQAHTDP
jgi:hypothetical protein